MHTDPVQTVRIGINNVLSTLHWAEDTVPGTNLQADIIYLEKVALPALDRIADGGFNGQQGRIISQS